MTFNMVCNYMDIVMIYSCYIIITKFTITTYIMRVTSAFIEQTVKLWIHSTVDT